MNTVMHFLAHLFMLNKWHIENHYDKTTGKVISYATCKTCGKICFREKFPSRRFGMSDRRVK